MKRIITIAIIIIVLISVFFIKTNYKSFKFGNNMSNKTTKEIAQYILDINSYKTKETITIESNKNTNNYVIEEEYLSDQNISKRKILEPENLNGVSFIYDGMNLKVENTELSLSKIYANYSYIGENIITLESFINDYKTSEETNLSEDEKEITMEVKIKNGNKYIEHKKLYINRQNGMPIKLEIKDLTQKTTIYILYNEIEINNLQKEDILAFSLEENLDDI